ncbi:MAG: hypothetical protein WDO73_12545 [Ignavibacteriota bacterium]
MTALVALSPADIPRVDTVSLDYRAILFLLGAAVLTALLFGLAPAMQASAGNLSARSRRADAAVAMAWSAIACEPFWSPRNLPWHSCC